MRDYNPRWILVDSWTCEVLLVNTCGKLDINSINEAISYLNEITGEDTKVIWGTVHGDDIEEGKIMVTIIATGMREKVNPSITLKVNKEVTPELIPSISCEKSIQQAVNPRSSRKRELNIPDFLKSYAK